jgi:predicted anti-sigma-YlaC factor YlaD
VETCKQLKENLILFAHGELDDRNGKQLADHLATCSGCQAEFQQISTLLANIKDTAESPQLSNPEVKSLISGIKWNLGHNRHDKWWQRYLNYSPARLIPALTLASVLVIAVGIIGYLNLDKTRETLPLANQQAEEILLSDRDLEIIENLDFLKEMDAIQKISRVVDQDEDNIPYDVLDHDTRGKKQDGDGRHFV